MAPIFIGRTSNALRSLGSCFFPGCARLAEHQHHIVYFPEEVKKPLCRPHHEEITILNGQQARKCRHELSNSHRWWIWYQWLEGKLKPRRTAKALEYLEEWDQQPSPVLDSMAQPEKEQSIVFREAPRKKSDDSRKRKKKESKGNAKRKVRK
jgi:hypothetical protein